MFKSGITVRWLLTTILVIAIILAGFAVMITFSIRGYYYDTVEKKLQAMGQSSTLADYFSEYIGSTNDVFAERPKEYVENFSEINTDYTLSETQNKAAESYLLTLEIVLTQLSQQYKDFLKITIIKVFLS